MERVVKPEILDSLDQDDLKAIRSRKDLRMINWFMRGEAWILGQLKGLKNLKKVVELGSGDGHLASAIKRCFPSVEVIAVDLQSRPETVDDLVIWHSENVLDCECFDTEAVVVANLFVHHLEKDQLRILGEKMANCRAVLLAEPHRHLFSKLLGCPLYPFINHVTRHDMMVSIEAGFCRGELAVLLGLDWNWDESVAVGGIRSAGKPSLDLPKK